MKPATANRAEPTGARHEIARAVAAALWRFAERLRADDDPAENPRLTDELVDATAEEVLGVVTAPPLSARWAPPWAPVRYRMSDDRPGITGRLTIHGAKGDAVYYVTVSHYDTGEIGEVWIREKREGGTMGALLDALATAISIGLQSGIPWDVYASKFSRTRFEPAGMTDDDAADLRFVSSPLDYIVRWIGSRKATP